MPTAKEKKPSVWKNYFGMLFKAGLPWVLMLVCFLISFGRAELTLMLADRIGSTFGATYADLTEAIWPLLILFSSVYPSSSPKWREPISKAF